LVGLVTPWYGAVTPCVTPWKCKKPNVYRPCDGCDTCTPPRVSPHHSSELKYPGTTVLARELHRWGIQIVADLGPGFTRANRRKSGQQTIGAIGKRHPNPKLSFFRGSTVPVARSFFPNTHLYMVYEHASPSCSACSWLH
jgi:hypothetical protein